MLLWCVLYLASLYAVQLAAVGSACSVGPCT